MDRNMIKNARDLYLEGHKNIVCTFSISGAFTEGKVYNICDGVLNSDGGAKYILYNECGSPCSSLFKPYEFFGMSNKVFTPEEIEQLATLVAAKVIEKLKEKL